MGLKTEMKLKKNLLRKAQTTKSHARKIVVFAGFRSDPSSPHLVTLKHQTHAPEPKNL